MNLPRTSDKIDHKTAKLKDISADEHVVRVTQAGQDSHIRVDLSPVVKPNGASEYRCVLGFTARRVLVNYTLGRFSKLIRETVGYA